MSGFFGKMLGALGGDIREKFGPMMREYLEGPGLQKLVDQAKAAGLEEKVRSWIGNGENLPISADEIRRLLTSDQLETIVAKTGLPAAALLPAIAQFLPETVDAHTPEGKQPEEA